jgi:ribokinase
MYDIITFGSAAQDIGLKSKDFKIFGDNKEFATGQGICFTLGSKINIQDISFTSGGGGSNVAVALARQGFKTAFCGAVGADNTGREIIKELKKEKVDVRFVVEKKEKQTNQSIIIFDESQERTILTYRGAAELLTREDIPWKKIKAKWIYLAPLTGLLLDSPKSADGGGCALEDIVNFAAENKIKVAINPSKQQLSLPENMLKNILQKTDILFLNQEEASFLTKVSFEQENEIFKKIDTMCSGVAVMTKGGQGVVASDGKYLYSALPNNDRKIVDTTGAGDSFAAGFLSDYIRNNGDIEKSIQLGLANSEANLAEIGAKTGLLRKGDKFNRVNVVKEECGENNLCIKK